MRRILILMVPKIIICTLSLHYTVDSAHVTYKKIRKVAIKYPKKSVFPRYFGTKPVIFL